MTSSKLKKYLGQLFIIGYPGESPSQEFLSFVAEERIGGVILFGDNCASHEAARTSIESIKGGLKRTIPFVAIDQEGGRVARLKGAPAEIRSAEEYGKGDILRFREDYSRAVVYMESIGFNLNLAPVADIYLDPNNTVLKGRCFGTNADQVSAFVRESITVTKESGLLSCIKHFPGLGAASIDPHQAVATVDYDRYVWEQREAIPFSAGIAAGADLIMTTHVMVPTFDQQIITGSAPVVSELIRGFLGFDGPIVTDDLCMQGAAALGDIGERTVAAFLAGHDLLLFGQSTESSMQAYDYFVDSVGRGEIPDARLREAIDRIGGLKFKLERSVMQ